LNLRIGKTAVVAIIAGVLSLFTAVPRVHADDDAREHCRRSIEKAEMRLDHAIQRHGERSHEAMERRRDLTRERERCWDRYHGWWNGRERLWENERNWVHDRDDRDRDNRPY